MILPIQQLTCALADHTSCVVELHLPLQSLCRRLNMQFAPPVCSVPSNSERMLSTADPRMKLAYLEINRSGLMSCAAPCTTYLHATRLPCAVGVRCSWHNVS